MDGISVIVTRSGRFDSSEGTAQVQRFSVSIEDQS